MMKRNLDALIKLIKEFEGFRSHVYLCPANKCTIGYGYTIRNPETGRIYTGPDEMDEAERQFPSGVTEERATEMLKKYLEDLAADVAPMVSAYLTDNQFLAILDFCYNVGIGNFRDSTLRKRINAGQFDDVPNQFRRWNKAEGKVLPGLARRREAEIALWFSEGEAK
jgi:lysozyme